MYNLNNFVVDFLPLNENEINDYVTKNKLKRFNYDYERESIDHEAMTMLDALTVSMVLIEKYLPRTPQRLLSENSAMEILEKYKKDN